MRRLLVSITFVCMCMQVVLACEAQAKLALIVAQCLSICVSVRATSTTGLYYRL